MPNVRINQSRRGGTTVKMSLTRKELAAGGDLRDAFGPRTPPKKTVPSELDRRIAINTATFAAVEAWQQLGGRTMAREILMKVSDTLADKFRDINDRDIQRALQFLRHNQKITFSRELGWRVL